jgi:Rrf2 family iron-sulfur cluster assembly transcriptional regulator
MKKAGIGEKQKKGLTITDIKVENSSEIAMLYSHTGELAIRAALYLALQPPGRLSTVHTIAAGTGMPKSYLAKIIRKLVDAGLVRSFRGPGGGVELGRAPAEISLWNLMSAVDGCGDIGECVLGEKMCRAEKPCPLHEQWGPLREQMKKMLDETTLATMVKTLHGRETSHGNRVVPGTSSVTRSRSGEGEKRHAS